MCEKPEILKPDVCSVNQFGSETYDFFSQSIRKWNIGFFQSINLEVNLGFFRSINLEVTGLFLFQSINLEVKPRFDIPWSGWLLTTQMKQLKYLSLKAVLRKIVIMKRYSPTCAFMKEGVWVVLENICLCWELFFSADPFLEGGRGPSY